MSEEIWVPVPIEGYADLYDVSNLGKVRNKKLQIIKPYQAGKYLYIGMKCNGELYRCMVHRLVACAFVEDPTNDPQKDVVNHIDGNKVNNAACNLEESDKYRQMQHAYKNNLMRDMRGDSVGLNKISRDVVSKIRSRSKKEMGKDLAKEFGISKAQVSRWQTTY